MDSAVITDHPGCFAVACGLALAAIGAGPMRTNLHPNANGKLLGRITRAIRKPSGRSAWGIDIGASSLKAVHLTIDSKSGRVVMEDAVLIKHTKALGQAANDEEEDRIVCDSLDGLLSLRGLKGHRICTGLPGKAVLGRELRLPPVKPAKEAELVQYEARHQLPFRLDDVVWDYQLFDPSDSKSPDGKLSGILVAAKRTQAERRLNHFQDCGIPVHLMQSDCAALHNFLAYEYFSDSDRDRLPDANVEPAYAALDLGGDGANLVVSAPSCAWFRVFGLGGTSLTRALVRELNLTYAEAEKRVRQPLTSPNVHEMYQAILPVLEDLLAEIQTTLDSFTTSHENQRVVRILGLGGVFRLHGLMRFLRTGR
jgi:type IV pilus assembly protein PilM